MQRKDVNEIIASTNEYLQNVIKVELERMGGECILDSEECCHPAFGIDGYARTNHFEKVFINKSEYIVFVKYFDEYGNYEDPLALFSIDELIEILDGM